MLLSASIYPKCAAVTEYYRVGVICIMTQASHALGVGVSKIKALVAFLCPNMTDEHRCHSTPPALLGSIPIFNNIAVLVNALPFCRLLWPFSLDMSFGDTCSTLLDSFFAVSTENCQSAMSRNTNNFCPLRLRYLPQERSLLALTLITALVSLSVFEDP